MVSKHHHVPLGYLLDLSFQHLDPLVLADNSSLQLVRLIHQLIRHTGSVAETLYLHLMRLLLHIVKPQVHQAIELQGVPVVPHPTLLVLEVSSRRAGEEEVWIGETAPERPSMVIGDLSGKPHHLLDRRIGSIGHKGMVNGSMQWEVSGNLFRGIGTSIEATIDDRLKTVSIGNA